MKQSSDSFEEDFKEKYFTEFNPQIHSNNTETISEKPRIMISEIKIIKYESVPNKSRDIQKKYMEISFRP